ncbi:PKD domain-containing protein [Methanosarcina sp. DH2]|uniref:PKD domain-containing protein n=1 Tax=Methanosarcina sp. DH2 TaxID=2605639 RepID=UPI001E406B0D|nr:PKD domain-containing protein [Methanosarcina sp. DH2]MCC4769883.1 PKD domain-containing protein [Methanosarcina sp. DH2]
MDGGIEIRNKLVILLGIFLILALISGTGAAAEIIVQPGNSIQAAINSSSSGDVITIKPGTYTENVKITTGNLTIRSESGNPDNTIIKAKSSTVNVISVQADNVKISGIRAVGASGSSYSGIYLSGCNKCVIENNKLLSNGRGIYLVSSKGCTISKNTIMNNGYYGIVLGSSSANTISGNTASSDARGIHLGSSDDNKVSGNTVASNSAYGMYVCGLSDRNLIYNNYFNNTNMTIKSGTGNAYNTTKVAGKNIISGTYIGGNYWGKPDGTGFSDTAVDKDGDGISDSAYTSISSSIYSDYLPLVIPSNPAAPDADFSSNITSGDAPLAVLFTDTSTGTATAWNWSFGDGTYSAQKNPVHTYSMAGNYTVSFTAGNTAGNDTKTKENYIKVTTAQKPVVSYWGTPRSGDAPLTVTFKDNSSGSPTAWNWSFGDGTYATVQNPKHTYSAAGTYTIKLTTSNAAGNTTLTKYNYIAVTGTAAQTPVASFSSNVTSGKAPLNVLFTDTSTGTPTAWNWSFGDGTYSTVQNPVHTYSSAGNYTVMLTASNVAGNTTVTKTNYISVGTDAAQMPVASFSASPTSGNAPLSVIFTDSSTGNPTAWKWDFGDGNNSAVQNPVHAYSTAGNHTVTLTVTNAAGSNTVTKSNYIKVTGTTAQMPVAAFSASPTSGNAPLSVTFTDSSSGSPTTWSWNFGDGTSSTQKSPTHTYSTAGNYTVTLTVTNAAGSNTATKSSYISVGTTAQKPVMNYWGTPRSGSAPLTVTFKDNSSGSPTAWNWSFGDGTYSTVQNPKHTYSAAGTYTIALTATNAAGSTTSTKYNYITVTGTAAQTPVASFSSNATSGSAPFNVLFTDTSTGTPTVWNWNFGDGTSSTAKSPVHTYSAAGNYTVALTVTSAAGSNTVTKSNYITVTGIAAQTPVINCWGTPRSGTAPLTVTFKDNSTGSPTAWNWSFGDGTYATVQNPKHTYSAAGSYTIKLTVTNGAGSTTTTKYNYIVVSKA